MADSLFAQAGFPTYLVFDTETNGLPKSWKAPHTDLDNWPRVVQIAWELFDLTGQQIEAQCYLIRPDGFTIPKETEAVHGISTAMATERGIPIAEALGAFVRALSGAAIVVGHNIDFDRNIVGAELHRMNHADHFHGKTRCCTMEASTDFCKLPGRYGFKWPTLAELHWTLFNVEALELHDAAADVATCSKCFFELKRRGVIPH